MGRCFLLTQIEAKKTKRHTEARQKNAVTPSTIPHTEWSEKKKSATPLRASCKHSVLSTAQRVLQCTNRYCHKPRTHNNWQSLPRRENGVTNVVHALLAAVMGRDHVSLPSVLSDRGDMEWRTECDGTESSDFEVQSTVFERKA